MTKDWVHSVSHSPVYQILQIVVRAIITPSLPAWTSSARMLSIPADSPFFNDCTAVPTSLRRMGWSSSMSFWGLFSTDGSPLALWLYTSEQYSVHRFSISCSSVRHFLERSWIVVKSFTSWYAFLLLFLLRFYAVSLHRDETCDFRCHHRNDWAQTGRIAESESDISRWTGCLTLQAVTYT